VLSKHRLGKSSEPITKNIWKTGEFGDAEDTDEDERNRSKSIQVMMHVPNLNKTILSVSLNKKDTSKSDSGAQSLSK
jgi:hypothetical protein